jgi:6-phosphogluconolactonase (cycloisomerase 2 family)
VLDSRGALAFAGGFRGAGIVSCRLDPISGALSSAGSTGGEPDLSAAIFPDPLGRFTYVLWGVSGPFGRNPHLDTYRVDPVSGAFTLASTSGTTFPYPIVLHPGGAFAYGADSQGGGQLFGFAVAAMTGVLTQIQTLTVASNFSLAVHPSGLYLYHAQRDENLTIYTIDPSTGHLTFKTAVILPAAPLQDGIAITPTGVFMYVLLSGDRVAELSIDPATGVPAFLGTIGTGLGAHGIAVLRTVS